MNEQELRELYDALATARHYITGAYECAFPDEMANMRALDDVDTSMMRLETLLGLEPHVPRVRDDLRFT